MLLEQCKGVHCVDLGESFQTHIFLENLASIQPRTSPLKFAGGGSGSEQAARQAYAPDAADGVLAVDAPAVLRVRRVREVREVLRDLDRFKIWNTYVQDPPTP